MFKPCAIAVDTLKRPTTPVRAGVKKTVVPGTREKLLDPGNAWNNCT